MKGILVLLVAALTSATSYFAYLHSATQPTETMLAKPDCGMEWLGAEFQLTGEQFAKIKELHDAYRPKCTLMCQRIGSANERLAQLLGNNQSMTPEIEAALRECATVQEECRSNTLAHIYAVRAVMGPESGARYFKMMSARIFGTAPEEDTAISRSAPSTP